MRSSIRLGRIFGIPVGLDWSLLVIAAILSASLAVDRFPSEFPGYGAAAYWGVALLAAGLFFGSLLAHELAHSVVARRHGIPVHGITLWLLGGVARLGGEAPSAGAEFRIAAAGPATSLLLGGVFAGVATMVDALGLPGLVGSSFAWLAFVNVLLAGFNLIPAAPLDGGRILTAAVWARNGNHYRAMLVASRVGVVFGWVLIGLGVLSLFVGIAGTGLWTIFVGWFVLAAARQEGEVAKMRLSLGELRVRDAMTPYPPLARGWMTVDAFLAEEMPWLRESVIPVARFDGTIAGVVTLDRLRAVPPHERGYRRVIDYAIPLSQLRTAEPDERLTDVMLRPAPGPLPHVLVFDGSQLVGLVSPADIERAAAAGGVVVSRGTP